MLREVKRTRAGLVSGGTIAKRVKTLLSREDRLAAIRLRFGVGRDRAAVEPGLYFAGKPDAKSPVLVTANYRLTFDAVRRELKGLDAWLLVIDTKGVNVWCAAGKGTFCAEEVERRISLTGLDRVAPASTLVLPQLSASGVDARALASATGRRVVFGPVYARDIAEFLRRGMIKNDAMRAVRFGLRDRAVIVPVELAHSWPLFPAFAVLAALIAYPGTGAMGLILSERWIAAFLLRFLPSVSILLGSLALGTIVFPLLLPYLPGKFFSVKGFFLSGLWTVGVLVITREIIGSFPLVALSSALVGCAVSSYLAMNYTGASTFTCQRGTEREVSLSLPVMAISAGAGLIVAIARCILAIVRGGAS